jgi:hypothetical protein
LHFSYPSFDSLLRIIGRRGGRRVEGVCGGAKGAIGAPSGARGRRNREIRFIAVHRENSGALQQLAAKRMGEKTGRKTEGTGRREGNMESQMEKRRGFVVVNDE